MRAVSQVAEIVNSELSGALFALEATIVSVSGGLATVQPTAKRVFPDNDESISYPPVSGVRLLSLVWNGGKSGVSGKVAAGDECLLIAISHGDGEQADHKMLSACCAFIGFNDKAAHPMPDSVGIRIFNNAANITLDDNNITVDDGGGAKLVFEAGRITMTAPDGFTVNGNTQLNGDVGIAGNLEQTAGEEGENRTAKLNSNLEITGTSTAADHVSGGISGKGHEHPNGNDGNPTGSPIAE